MAKQKNQKLDEEGKSAKADVPLKVDTFFGIANLVEAQTHLEFSAQRVLALSKRAREKGKEEIARKLEELAQNQFSIAQLIRRIRGSVLSKFLRNIDEDIYCAEKHLMESVLRFVEVAEKHQTLGDEEKAKFFLEASDNIHKVFWLIQELPRIEDIDKEIEKELIEKAKQS